jgi:hypothetical protein
MALANGQVVAKDGSFLLHSALGYDQVYCP